MLVFKFGEDRPMTNRISLSATNMIILATKISNFIKNFIHLFILYVCL